MVGRENTSIEERIKQKILPMRRELQNQMVDDTIEQITGTMVTVQQMMLDKRDLSDVKTDSRNSPINGQVTETQTPAQGGAPAKKKYKFVVNPRTTI